MSSGASFPAGWLARDAGMLARCGRVLLRGDGTARGFERLGVLSDAFDLVDDRFVGALRGAVKSIQGAFTVTHDVRPSDDGLATWCDTFRTIKQWEAWQAHGQWIRAVHPRFAPNIEASFESASRVTDIDRLRALDERERLLGALHASQHSHHHRHLRYGRVLPGSSRRGRAAAGAGGAPGTLSILDRAAIPAATAAR